MEVWIMASADLLEQVLAPEPGPFALLHRPGVLGRDRIEVLIGDVSHARSLCELDLSEPSGPTSNGRHETLALIPFRQLAERGFACVDDGEPLLKMRIREQAELDLAQVLERIPSVAIELIDAGFDVDDDAYAATVRRIVAEEIGSGEGANFVLKRTHCSTIRGYEVRDALAFFARLVRQETGAHWTFVVHTGERTFVGATPERHLGLSSGKLSMNPISGTYRYPPTGPTLDGVLAFLDDAKESDELYMVVDEELKMMARLCDSGGRLVGPYLREMANLAHTEYVIEGRTSRNIAELLRETMFAPTVVGSPLESACRVIRRYEPDGRRYYAGVISLSGRDPQGDPSLDSAILIRTADIDWRGLTRITVGATIVRHSDPVAEAAETRAKASGLLAALRTSVPVRYGEHPRVSRLLAQRNSGVARFWCGPDDGRSARAPDLVGMRALVIDAEDNFTFMLEHQLQALGLEVTVRRFDEEYRAEGFDLVVMGPGPGTPLDIADAKIAHLRGVMRRLLEEQRPFLAVCLSHQVLCGLLGLPIEQRAVPNQGVRTEIDLFGERVRVGFYNAFSARSATSSFTCDGVGDVEVSRDAPTNEVYALRGPHFRSLQFHAESILSPDGAGILRALVLELLAGAHITYQQQHVA
jgi:phenazine biosynthesis protein phzE